MARGRVFRRQGGYAYRVDLGPDPASGRRRQEQRQGFRTKREAEQALHARLGSIESGEVVERSRLTVAEFLDDWLETQRDHLRPTTWASYRVVVERLKSKIGAVRLQALNPLDLERLYRELMESGGRDGRPLSAKSVRNTHTVLRKALGDAERLGLVVRNPAASAKPPSAAAPEHRTWTSDEVREFLGRIEEHRLYGLFVLLATTGMRRGEAMGLRWSDVDFDGESVQIVQTLTTVNSRPVVSRPKTKRSRRLVFLDSATVAVLLRHRRQQLEERLEAGEAWNSDHDLVFRDELGDLVNPDWLTREFARLVRASGQREIRLHDLRHTYATLALKRGVHPKVVSERLGHATIAVTLDLYSHVTPAIDREAADVVAGAIFQGP